MPANLDPRDCYTGDPELLPIAEAYRRIESDIEPLDGSEMVALRDALGRVSAVAVTSPRAVPPYTNSAMDGYAVSGDALPGSGECTLPVLGTAWAGRPYAGSVNADKCVRIMTGAAMPDGTDTVIPQEQCEELESQVRFSAGHQRGQNVRAAGEDLREGQVVIPAGVRLHPAELGLLASLGQEDVSVKPRLRVAYFSTGDELRSLGEPLDPGAIYDSNRYTLYGMLSRLGVEIIDRGVVRDEPDAIRDAFRDAASRADVIITSGGVSAGAADYVQTTLDELGEVRFWKIAIRPGRPLAYGKVGDARFFGLPGNPVAVMVTFYQFVQPALRRLMGETAARPVPILKVRCGSQLRKKPGRTEYYRAVLEHDENGELVVNKTGKQGSGVLSSMSAADCFVILPDDAETIEPGALVDVQPFYGLV